MHIGPNIFKNRARISRGTVIYLLSKNIKRNTGQGEKETNCSPTKNELVHEKDHHHTIFHEIQRFSPYLVLTQNSKKILRFPSR